MYTISPYLAEFLGTLIMCTIGCGVIANVELRRSKGHGDNFFTIAFGWGFAVTFGVYASHAYSGGHLNPAVSIGLAAFGEFSWEKVPGYIIAPGTRRNGRRRTGLPQLPAALESNRRQED